MPIKCAGAPHKIAFLTEDFLTKKGKNTKNIDFYLTKGVIFGVPIFSDKLVDIYAERGINTHLQHSLVNLDNNRAVFKNAEGETIEKEFDVFHYTPRQVAPQVL